MGCLSAQRAFGACVSPAGSQPTGSLPGGGASPLPHPRPAPALQSPRWRKPGVRRGSERCEPLVGDPESASGSKVPSWEGLGGALTAPPHTTPTGGLAAPVPALTFLWLFMSRPFSLRSFTNVLAR